MLMSGSMRRGSTMAAKKNTFGSNNRDSNAAKSNFNKFDDEIEEVDEENNQIASDHEFEQAKSNR